MDKCPACGAAVIAGAAWCGQCFTAVAAPATGTPTVVSAAAPGSLFGAPSVQPGRYAPAQTLERPVRTTRWAKTDTTFGPAGRVAATVALAVPLAVMVVGGLADPFVWGGAGVWGLVIMPWGLRDVWKAGRVASA